MAQNLVEYILDIKTKSAEQGLDNIVDSLEDVQEELENTQEETEETSSKFEKFKKTGMAIGKIGAVIGAVTIAITAAGGAAFSLAKKMADLTNELNDLSVRSGLATKTISGLRFALIASGQPAEGLNEILGAISGQFAQLSTEGSAVEKKFNDFGIAVRNTSGELRSNNEIMLDGIRLLQGISDSSERSRVAVTLFGEAGSKLNQALAAGDFERFLAFTEKFGIKTGPEASRAAANFQVAISAMTLSFDGMLQKFTQSTGLIDKVTDQLINIGSVFAFVGSLIESFSKEIGTMAEAFERDFKVIMDILGVFVDLISETVGALTPMGGAFEKAFADAEEFRAGMEEFKKTLTAVNSTSGNTEKAIDSIGQAANNTKKEVRDLSDVFDDLLGKFGIKLIDFNSIIKDASIVAKSISQLFKLQIAPVVDNIYVGTLQKALDLTLKIEGFFASLFGVVGVGADKVVGKFADKITQGNTKIFAKLTIAAMSLIDSIGIKIATLLESDFASGIANKVGNVFGKIADKFSEGVSSGFSKGAGFLMAAVKSIGAVINIAGNLGQRGSTVEEIEKSVEEDIKARAKAIELGLQALPKILLEVLPRAFVQFVDRIIFGFFKAIAELVNIIINGFKSIFTREGLKNIGKNIKEGFKRGLQEFFDRINILGGILSKRGGGRYIPSARGGIKFTGADEGLAMLHRGEFVVPETGQMPQAVQRTMGMGQGGVTININASVVESNAIDELVRQIERRFRTFGSSTSPLFGGR
jgi:methyl-accepting chemotaxis protein